MKAAESTKTTWAKSKIEINSREVNAAYTLTTEEVVVQELVAVISLILGYTDKWRSESYHFVSMDLYNELIKLNNLTRRFKDCRL